MSAILGAFANHGLFRSGAVLVGSLAYGAVLNELGIRAAAFATEDVDLARGEPLHIERAGSFEQILAASTVVLGRESACRRASSWRRSRRTRPERSRTPWPCFPAEPDPGP